MPKQKTIAAVGVIFGGLASLVDYLSQRDVTVKTYENGQEDFEKLVNASYDLILLGLPMRGERCTIDALDIIRREDSPNKHTPVYVLHYDSVKRGYSPTLQECLGTGSAAAFFEAYNAMYVNLTSSGAQDHLVKRLLRKLHGSNGYLPSRPLELYL